MRIPSEAKTRGGQMKQILKKAVRGLIPDELIDRRKQGFGVPVYEWYSDRLGDHARREIRAFNDSTGLLNPQAVQGIFERNDGWASWFLLNLSLWGKQYLNTH
jgi:asparagine synthase (glutamine-hydrolysing)